MKCVYGDHEVQARCPTMYWNAEKVPCEPESEPAIDPNFASLLEREPMLDVVNGLRFRGALWDAIHEYTAACGGDTGIATAGGRRMDAVVAVERLVMPDGFSPTREGWVERVGAQMCRAEKAERERDLAKKTADSQASRIKELEGVLVAVRAKASAIRLVVGMSPVTQAAVDAITSLINETLDPCKPWCVLEPGHGGACASDVEFCEDRDE